MLNPYHERIDVERVFSLQSHQYQQAMYMDELIPANTQRDISLFVSTEGHFMLCSITGAYSSLTAEDADSDGCPFFVQLLDGNTQRPLFDDFVWAGLFLSPGRFQAVPGVGSYSNQLYLEFPFVYTFGQGGAILVKVQNNAAYENRIKMLFKGIRIFGGTRDLA